MPAKADLDSERVFMETSNAVIILQVHKEVGNFSDSQETALRHKTALAAGLAATRKMGIILSPTNLVPALMERESLLN